MAIGKSYPKDNRIQDADLFLGTKASTLSTVNYTAQSVSDYLNNKGKISIGGQMVFQFVTANPSNGTISLPSEGGDGDSFSSITNLIVSTTDFSTQNVVNFIDYIIGSEILLTEQNQISTFGNYKITQYEVTIDPGFYNLTLEYIGGYGNINKDLFYDLTFFRSNSGEGIPTKTSDLINDGEDGINPFITLQDLPPSASDLQEVTDNGNETTNDIKANSFQVYDSVNGEWIAFTPEENGFKIIDAATGKYIFSAQNDNFSLGDVTDDNRVVFSNNLITANRALEIPDADGTLALTSDISIPDLQQVTDEGNIVTSGNYLSMFAANMIETVNIVTGTGSAITPDDGVLIKTGIYKSNVKTDDLTVNRIHQLPDADGTLALTTDVTNKVPYTGATEDVDLGLFNITAAQVIKDGGIATQFLKADGSVDNNTYLTSADLPSTLDLYATTFPDPIISGYTALVRNITDSRYNTTAVDVPTPTITGTVLAPTFCGAVISDPSILLGNPGVFNFSVIGKIRRTGGSTSSGADFFFSIYKRDLAGVETFIASGAPVVVPANGGVYIEYISIALWNNGTFLSTDRVVLKFYGIKTGGGSGAAYEFQFGGADPVRGTAAISSAIIPNLYLRDLADVEKTDALNNEVLYWNDADSLWEHSLVTDLIPDASATARGLVSTATQAFTGEKTFLSTVLIKNDNDNLKITSNNYSPGSLGTVLFFTTPSGLTCSTINSRTNGGGFNGDLVFQSSGNGKVGIGIDTLTQTPIAKLDVRGDVNISNGLTVAGTVVLPSTTSIGDVSNTEIGYLNGVTSPIQTQIDAVNVNVITITTAVSINTDTVSGTYGQHGRHSKISNGANAINIQCVSTSNADFVASYEKIGTATITFTAGAGITLTTLSGTAAMTGVAGSKACLSRNGSIYYLQITNY
jgi:hypothetical protein